jgi:hypothetical protein
VNKKLVVGIVVAGALALTGCGSSGYDGYSTNGGWSDSDWDLNNPSIYNNNTYCQGGTYNPLPNNQYSCYRNGVSSPPVVRPQPIIPPKSQQKPPAVKPAAPAAPKPAAPKPAAPKPAAPAPKAPTVKSK